MSDDIAQEWSPCGYNVLVRLDDFENKTESGIIIASLTETEKEQGGINSGVILAFGPTAYKGFAGCNGPEDWGVSVGCKVKFEKYAGTFVDYDADPRLVTVPDSTFKAVRK